jgi:hypothetical protein
MPNKHYDVKSLLSAVDQEPICNITLLVQYVEFWSLLLGGVVRILSLTHYSSTSGSTFKGLLCNKSL